MSFARKLKNFFDTPTPTKRIGKSSSHHKEQKFFNVNKIEMTTEEKIMKALKIEGSLRGKTLYQKLAAFEHLQALSRPQQDEVNQTVYRMQKEGKINLLENAQKKGVKYASVQVKGYKTPETKAYASVVDISSRKNKIQTGMEASQNNQEFQSSLIQLASEIPSNFWFDLCKNPNFNKEQLGLCRQIGEQLKKSKTTLSYAQACLGLKALNAAAKDSYVSEEWMIKNLCLDPLSFEILLQEIK